MNPIAILLLMFSLSGYPQNENCKCRSPSANQQTSWGHEHVIIRESRVFKSLRGKAIITANGQPLDEVLVEVYDKPEGLLMDWRERKARMTQQRRVAACVTGADGKFCFQNIPPGKYELRFSKPREWDPISVYAVVAPDDPHSTDSGLTIFMRPSA